MTPRQNEHDKSPQEAAEDLPETDRKSKAPRKPQDTDDAGNALNDVGEDNHRGS